MYQLDKKSDSSWFNLVRQAVEHICNESLGLIYFHELGHGGGVVGKPTNNNTQSRQPLKVHTTRQEALLLREKTKRHVAPGNLKTKNTPSDPLALVILNSQSRGAYFSVNVLILTNDVPCGAGKHLTHWSSWLTQAWWLNLATWRSEAEWDSRETIHCAAAAGAGPTYFRGAIVIQPSQI